jgi:hypothetical protein
MQVAYWLVAKNKISNSAWNLPLATKQNASLLTSKHWIHFKGHQIWNLPLAINLGSSFVSLFRLLFKDANLDHLSFSFWTWFLIWIFENFSLQLSSGGKKSLNPNKWWKKGIIYWMTIIPLEEWKWVKVDLKFEILNLKSFIFISTYIIELGSTSWFGYSRLAEPPPPPLPLRAVTF